MEILSNPSVVQHNPSDLTTELEDVEALVRRWQGRWKRHGFGNCCVCDEIPPSTTREMMAWTGRSPTARERGGF
ncbi:hypothetical protein LQK93_02609 [Terrabacter sp. BE26]